MLFARRESRSGKRLFSRIAIAVGAPFLAVAVAVLLRPWLEPLSTAGFDLYQRLSPYTLAANPVIVVDIDDSSLARIGGRSWSPRILAELLDRLREAGARVVGFDLRFAEPSRSGSSNGTSPALGDVPDAESRFAEAIARMPVVLGFDLVGARQGRGTVIAKAPIGFAGSTGGDPTRALYRFPEAVADRQPLQNAAAGIGFANTLADTDGKLRKAPLIATLGNRIVPSFAAEVVRVAQGTRLYLGRAGRHGMNGLLIGTQPVATDDYGVVWLRYGGSRPDRFIHAADVLSGNFDAGALAQRIVLVGVTAPSLGDRWNTPVADSMPGVEILAQFIEGILEGGLVTRPSWIIGAEILSALLAGVLLMAVAPFGRPRLIIAAGALIAVAAAMSWYGFLRWQLAIDPVLPTAVIALVGVATIPLHRPKRAQLRHAEC